MSDEADMVLDDSSSASSSSSSSSSSHAPAPEPLPTIELSFSTGKGGAWDDRELINAYDAAMDEFHVHHPGPGSWLDKATAALAQGRPLPGASAHATSCAASSYLSTAPLIVTARWYTASLSESAPPLPEPPRKKLKSKPKPSNPYSASRPDHPAANPASSPIYNPPSPLPPPPKPLLETAKEYDGVDWAERNGRGEGLEIQPQPGDSIQPLPQSQSQSNHVPDQQGIYPTPSSSWAGAAASRDDALTYALNAQYWAGYWMGVAKTVSTINTQPPAAVETREMEERGVTASNVVITRQQFGKMPVGSSLRR
ncbi:hypothetical protein P7C73_g2445, partial [Tremellales sp. Uapishka_1]